MKEIVLDHSKFDEVLKEMDLVEFWNQVKTTNPSANAPYHNNEHLYGVAMIADQLYTSCKSWWTVFRRRLIVGSLFHDYDHSMGVLTDGINVDRAITKLEGFRERDNFGWLPVRLIEITEYPFRHIPYSDTERSIRDADLLYTLTHPDPRRVLDGLRREMEVSFKRPIDLNELVTIQEKFWSTATFYTDVGKKIAPDLIKVALDDMRQWAREEI